MNKPEAENSGVSASPLRRKSQSFSTTTSDSSSNDSDARQCSPSSGGGREQEGDGLMWEKGEDEKISRIVTAVQQTWNWKILAFGQILSFLLAVTGFSQSSLHLMCSLSAPTFATGIVYVALLVNLIPIYMRGRRMLRSKSTAQGSLVRDEARASIWFLKRFPLHASPWAYFGIAILDVEANYATVMSFKYTTLTSAAVFDNMAIPSAMVLSRLFLKRKYMWLHLVGVMICLGGITVNVLIDYENDVRDAKEAAEAQEGDQQVNASDVAVAEAYPHRLLGDILAMVGGLLFGARDVLTEKTIREGENSMEYLGMIGLFGTLISTTQVVLVERQLVVEFFTSSDSSCAIETGLLLLLSYVVANILRYFGTARFLLLSEAALLNLSLLTGDLWSAMFSIVGQKIVPPALFWLALALILSGVLVYELAPSPIGNSERIRDEQAKGDGCDFDSPEGELEIPKISRAWIERV